MTRRVTQALATGIFAATLGFLGHGTSGAADRLKVKAISRADPFTEPCRPGGRSFPGADAEPHLALDPARPERLIAAWMDLDGISIVVASSRDHGRTWRETTVPRLRCRGDDAPVLIGDPWLSIGPDGTSYLALLTEVRERDPAGLIIRTNLMVSRSRDSGRSWSRPVLIADDSVFNDKPAVTADPKRPGRVYMTWTRSADPAFSSGDVYVSASRDSGRTWSAGRLAYDPGPGIFPWGATIRVLPSRTLLLAVMLWRPQDLTIPTSGRWEAVAIRSEDAGRTWSEPAVIGDVPVPLVGDPETVRKIRSNPYVSLETAADGTAYAAWHERGDNGLAQVVLAASRDGGRTWSSPSVVGKAKTQAFLPAVATRGRRGVAVSYYDLREDRLGDDELTVTYWLAISRDRGDTWEERRFGRFDGRRAPDIGQQRLFLGDYFGLVGTKRGYGAVFAQAPPDARHGPSDIFFGRATIRSKETDRDEEPDRSRTKVRHERRDRDPRPPSRPDSSSSSRAAAE